MELLCLGISYRTAPLTAREKLALTEEQISAALSALRGAGEAMILCTCNRAELYIAADEPSRARDAALSTLQTFGGPEALNHLYEHKGDEAVLHLFRVASSLDSMVLGEAQILGQVKAAFELAQRTLPSRGELSRACQAAFAAAKRVRTETAIGRSATSMASAAVEMAAKIFGALHSRTAVVVGAGEIAELAARHLASAKVKRLIIANRTVERAQALASSLGAEARSFEELPQLLVEADLLFSTTASPTPIFTRENVGPALKPRRHRPLFMVDLAVPRDISPDVHTLAGVYAYDVDDIQSLIAENAAARAAEAARAEQLVAEEVMKFARNRATRDATPVLQQLRARAEGIARAEVDRTLMSLGPSITDKQRKSIEAMGRAIVNKLLHEPTARLRAVSADDGENERLSGAAAELFGLEEETGEAAPEPKPAVSGVKG